MSRERKRIDGPRDNIASGRRAARGKGEGGRALAQLDAVCRDIDDGEVRIARVRKNGTDTMRHFVVTLWSYEAQFPLIRVENNDLQAALDDLFRRHKA